MWSAEWRKILIKQKGLLVIAAMVLLKIALTFQQGYDSNMIINKNPEGYAAYVTLYEGKLTAQKEQQLQAEYYAVNHAAGELEELARKWQAGKIDQESYEENSKSYYEKMKNSAVFQVVYNQYFYAKEAPDERYIMDERGWSTLLAHGTPDFILLLCLLIILTPLFCYEYESGMDALLLSSYKGKYLAGIVKLSIGSILAVTTTVLFTLIEWICLNQMVGMQHGQYPLHSLSFFANSEYHVSLNEALLLMLLCQVMGSVMLSGCISLVGMISKKSIITLFTGSAMVFLPYILFNGQALLYYLPLPSGLLEGTGYLWGTTYINNYNEHGAVEKVVNFQAINKGNFILMLLVYAIEIGILFLYGLKKYSRYTIKERKFRNGYRKLSVFLILLAIFSTTTAGCQMKGYGQDTFTFESEGGRNYGETAGYALSLDEAASMITARNLQTGEELTLTREPFAQEQTISAIFVRDGWCYYVAQTLGVEGIRIYGIDMSNFNQTLVYNSVRENTEDFYGMASGQENIEDILKNITRVYCFFLNEEHIYYIAGSDLVEINRTTHRETVVARDVKVGLSLVYYNGDVYYVDQQYRLSKYQKQDSKVYTVESIYTDDFDIEENRVKYRDLLDGKKINYYSIN